MGVDTQNTLLVSVAVLCYNQEKYIAQTMESIVSQETNFDYEIIIADDYSTDRTREILFRYKEKYPDKINLILNEKNIGLIANYVQTLKQAKGQYIAQCAGDDYWTDNQKLQKQVDFLSDKPDYAMVHTQHLHYIEKNNSFEQVVPIEKSEGIFQELLAGNKIGALTVMMRKDCFIEALNAGIFDLGFFAEDYPLWLYFAQRYKIGYLPDCTAIYRVLEKSVSRTNDPVKKYKFAQSVFDIRYFFGKETEYCPVLKKEINEYNFYWMLYAFRNNMKELSTLVHISQKKYNVLSIKSLLYYWGTQNKLLGTPLRAIIHLKNKILKRNDQFYEDQM
jgi:glycosyltransferase involved in cell wall biosynthesis